MYLVPCEQVSKLNPTQTRFGWGFFISPILYVLLVLQMKAMNKTTLLLCLLLVAFIGITSCNKDSGADEEPVPTAPELNVLVDSLDNPGQMTVDVGTIIRIDVNAIASAGIGSYSAAYTLNGTSTNIDTFEPDTLVTSHNTENFRFEADYTMAGDSIGFLFILTDTLGESVQETFSLLVNESPIRVDTGKIVSPYNYQLFGNIYNVLDSVDYFPLNVKSNLNNQKRTDFIIAYDRQAGYIMSSPSDADVDTIWNHNVSFDWPFQEINNTQFIELDTASVDFDQVVTAQQLADLFSDASVSALSGLYKGEIISLRLDGSSRGGRLALMKITSIVGNSKSERQITFDIKIEQ